MKKACSRVLQQRQFSVKFFIRSACLFFYANRPVYCQCSHKREEKSAGKRADVWLSPPQRLSTVL